MCFFFLLAFDLGACGTLSDVEERIIADQILTSSVFDKPAEPNTVRKFFWLQDSSIQFSATK